MSNTKKVYSLEERVAALPRIDMKEVIIHEFNEVSYEWSIADKGVELSRHWTPEQIQEYCHVHVFGQGDADCCIYDDDDGGEMLVTGWDIIDSHEANLVQTIQSRGDHGALGLIIINWE